MKATWKAVLLSSLTQALTLLEINGLIYSGSPSKSLTKTAPRSTRSRPIKQKEYLYKPLFCRVSTTQVSFLLHRQASGMKQAIHSSSAFVCHTRLFPALYQEQRLNRAVAVEFTDQRNAGRFIPSLIQPTGFPTEGSPTLLWKNSQKTLWESESSGNNTCQSSFLTTCTGMRDAHHGSACKSLMADSWGLSDIQRDLCFKATCTDSLCSC